MYLCNKCISDNNVSSSWFLLASPRHCPCRSHHHLNSSSATAQHQCQVTWPTKENVVTVLNNQVWGGDVGAKSARLHSFQELWEGGGDDELCQEVHVWIRAYPLLPSDHGKVKIISYQLVFIGYNLEWLHVVFFSGQWCWTGGEWSWCAQSWSQTWRCSSTAREDQQHFSGDFWQFIFSKFNFFSQFVKSWTSMEHNNKWEPIVRIFSEITPFDMIGQIGEEDSCHAAMGGSGHRLPGWKGHAEPITWGNRRRI